MKRTAKVWQMNDADHGGLQEIEIEYDETCCQLCYLPNGWHDFACPTNAESAPPTGEGGGA